MELRPSEIIDAAAKGYKVYSKSGRFTCNAPAGFKPVEEVSLKERIIELEKTGVAPIGEKP